MSLDQLQLALARYQEVRPDKSSRGVSLRCADLDRWVADEVCPVIAQLLTRADFQKLALWPLEHLIAPSASEERKAVEAVEAALAAWARAMATCARRSHPPRGDADAINAATHLLSELDFIAGRPWRDLVSADDFFYPRSELNLRDRAAYLGPNHQSFQLGEFLRFANPKLRRPGDFVGRMMIVRIDYWKTQLDHLALELLNSRRTNACVVDHGTEEFNAARARFLEARQLVETRCLRHRSARLCDSAAALVQCFAAYFPEADWRWLGADSALASRAAEYRRDIDGKGDTNITDRCSTALMDMADLFRTTADPDDEIAAKSRQYRLLVVTGRGARQVFWEGTLIDAPWASREKPWALLAALAEQAKCNAAVDVLSFCGEKKVQLKHRRAELKPLIPAALNDLIKPAGLGSYRLHLSAPDVCLLASDEYELLVEQSRSQLELLSASDRSARRRMAR